MIKMSLKSAKQPDFDTAFLMLRDEIVSEYSRHRYVLNSPAINDKDKSMYEEISSATADWYKRFNAARNKEEKDELLSEEIKRFSTALKLLSDCLKAYHRHGARLCMYLIT